MEFIFVQVGGFGGVYLYAGPGLGCVHLLCHLLYISLINCIKALVVSIRLLVTEIYCIACVLAGLYQFISVFQQSPETQHYTA